LGGLEFRFNGREIGHMHGDSMVDMPFPKDVGKGLIAQKKVASSLYPSVWMD